MDNIKFVNKPVYDKHDLIPHDTIVTVLIHHLRVNPDGSSGPEKLNTQEYTIMRRCKSLAEAESKADIFIENIEEFDNLWED